MKIEQLIHFTAANCHYAQELVCTNENGKVRKRIDEMEGAKFAMQATSYQVACTIAQYFESIGKPTGGVDWDVALDELVGSYKSVEIWERIIRQLFLDYDDWTGTK